MKITLCKQIHSPYLPGHLYNHLGIFTAREIIRLESRRDLIDLGSMIKDRINHCYVLERLRGALAGPGRP